MKSERFVLIIALTLLSLSGMLWRVQAQGASPLLIIHGAPDTTSVPPEVRTYVSVIDKGSAQAIEGLNEADFQLTQSGVAVEGLRVQEEPVGLAIVVVVDRGGISQPGDPRLKEATDLIRELTNRLSITNVPNDDVIAIVGVGEEGVLQPDENFTYNPVDINRIINALVEMESESIQGTTPLYNGMDEALRLLTENSDASIRDVLSHRRKLILTFSDGIDRNYSDEAKEGDIIRQAKDADISLYNIGMARRNQGLYADADKNLTRLASQTKGLYQLHNNDETHEKVLGLFDHIVTQRQQYLLSYDLDLPKANYSLSVLVDTSIGSAERETTFDSILETPQIRLISPVSDLALTVPYSGTLESFVPQTITLEVQILLVDGVARNPTKVRYFANGEPIGSSTTAPDFAFSWDPSDIKTPSDDPQEQRLSLTAEAKDAYLGTKMTTDSPVTVRVTWESLPPPDRLGPIPVPKEEISANWWLLALIGALALGLLALFIMLARTRGELARRAVNRTSGFLKGMTRRLPALSERVPGKLVITQGSNVGKEFPLVGTVVKVGRDPQFCDFALHDEYVSNPHFSIYIEGNKFYIQDEESKNLTKVNGEPLKPKQRQPLPADAVIEAGYVKLEFKQLKRDTTRGMNIR